MPVKSKIIGKKNKDPGPPYPADFKQTELVEVSIRSEGQSFHQNINDQGTQAHTDRSQRLLPLIKIALFFPIDIKLGGNGNQEEWYGIYHRVIGDLHHLKHLKKHGLSL